MHTRHRLFCSFLLVLWTVHCGGSGGGTTPSDPDEGSPDTVGDVADSIDDTDGAQEIIVPPDLGKEELPPDVPEEQCAQDADCDVVLTDLTVCQTTRCVAGQCVAESVEEDAPCDDGDQCTLETVCLSGECAGGIPRDCEDGNLCTLNECDSTTGCTMSPLSGTACDDGNDCTTGDGCLLGQCVGGTNNCDEVCDNGVDDNGDTMVDCFDPVCGTAPVCTHICEPTTTLQCDDVLEIDITGATATKYTADWPCAAEVLSGNELAFAFDHSEYVSVSAALVAPPDGAHILHLDDPTSTGCQADLCVSGSKEFIEFDYKPGDDDYIVVDTPEGTTDIFGVQVVCTACEPQCDGKSCGGDSCGGDCGSCIAGTVCTSGGQCIQPASNDTCAEALVVDGSDLPYIHTASTVGSDDDYKLPPDTGCPGSPTLAKGSGPADTVYVLQPVQTDTYLIAINADFNSTVYVISDCQNAGGTCIGVGQTSSSGGKTLVTELTAGVVYYIVVDGYAGKASGNYTLTVANWPCSAKCSGKQCGPNGCGGDCGTCAEPLFCSAAGKCVDEATNDTCATPKVITELNEWISDTTQGSVDDYYVFPEVCPGGPAIGEAGTGAPDLVYRFIPPISGKFRVTVDPTFNALLSVRDACPGELLDCIGGSDTTGQETVTFIRGKGQSIWFVVDGSAAGDAGSFNIKVEKLACLPQCTGKDCGPDACGGVCGQCGPTEICTVNGQCEFIPANDTCDQALVIDPAQLPFSHFGKTLGATNDYEVSSNTCPGGPAAATYGYGNDVSFQFTPSTAGQYVFSLDAFTTTFNTFLYAVTDCTDIAGTCLMAQDAPGNGAESVVVSLAVGETIYVVVDGAFTSSAGDYIFYADLKK